MILMKIQIFIQNSEDMEYQLLIIINRYVIGLFLHILYILKNNNGNKISNSLFRNGA